MSEDKLTIYTVYDHPSDYPDSFVVRAVNVGDDREGAIFGFAKSKDGLEQIRMQLEAMGLMVIPRDPSDDPVIIESWI